MSKNKSTFIINYTKIMTYNWIVGVIFHEERKFLRFEGEREKVAFYIH